MHSVAHGRRVRQGWRQAGEKQTLNKVSQMLLCRDGRLRADRAQIRVLGDEGGKDAESACDDAFLKKIEATMLTQARAPRPRRPPRPPGCRCAARHGSLFGM